MLGRGKKPPVDDEMARAQMLTIPPLFTAEHLSAQLIMVPARWSKKQQLKTTVLLQVGRETARMDLGELVNVATGTTGIAESDHAHGRAWFLALPWAASPTSTAEAAMVGIGPDQVAVLAEREDGGLARIATISTTQLSDLVTWAQHATAREHDARIAAPDPQR